MRKQNLKELDGTGTIYYTTELISLRCFEMTGEMPIIDTTDEFDTYAINHGWIAVTPLGLRTDLRGAEKDNFANLFERLFFFK